MKIARRQKISRVRRLLQIRKHAAANRRRSSSSWLTIVLVISLASAAPPMDHGTDRLPQGTRLLRERTVGSGSDPVTSTVESRGERSRFLPQPYFSPSQEPCRRIRLVNGDEITAELVADSGKTLELRLFGVSRVRVPLQTIAGISALPGERELLNESFAQPVHTGSSAAAGKRRRGALISGEQSPANGAVRELQRVSLPSPAGDFRCSFHFHLKEDASSGSAKSGWSWHFADRSRLAIASDHQGRWRAEFSPASGKSVTVQALAVRSGGHICRMQQLGPRLFLSLDNELLWAGPAPGGILESLEIHSADRDVGAGGDFVVDHLSLVEIRQPEFAVSTNARLTDAVFGLGGETWWGELQTVGRRGVAWSDGQTVWQRSWGDLCGITRRAATQPISGPRLTGCVARIELQPSVERPDLPGNTFTAVLGASKHGRLFVDHPLWGRFCVPHAAIRSVESRFLGDWMLLDGREITLGRSAHAGDRQPLSTTASPIAGRFELPSTNCGDVYFSLEASGLEPSGPQTPRGSPVLKDLRQGRLATELFVNDQRVGNFNELTNRWSLPGQFDRLRRPLPRELLRPGQNTWRIAQQPPGDARSQFDECVVRNMSLEIAPRSFGQRF